MMKNTTFKYTYSAERNKEVEHIRKKYIPEEESKFEKLKKLDRRVQMAGTIESLCLGIVGALLFGIGMCFFLEIFAGATWLTVLLMVIGTAIMIPAYSIYRRIVRKVKAELAPEILCLAEEIMKSAKN